MISIEEATPMHDTDIKGIETLVASGSPRRRARAGIAYNRVVEHSRLPGGDIVERGLRDLAASRPSAAADLVLIGAPRLRRLGLVIPLERAAGAEHRLYLRLAAEDPLTAHSRYNALIRCLVSFERAAACGV
ncbi:MAG: hypothetical protein K2Y23_01405 [Cyanobacteria bacterium]|nr:hypothetical protein [Cyanobacteriota bacterium]